jgi:hypothetical protein
LKTDNPTVFHHSACAPTLSARGHNSMYFANPTRVGRLIKLNSDEARSISISRCAWPLAP